ncbi:hypothetical protein Gotri_012405 [Gossypium trilobum]|uniref:Uncharacterized protein n=1 Tax=Gossypium trilobum TaxID=34281 RepID=A0A7J9DQ60_9ROSI|nr:hypothetical protein [Gossypium trilobum]
MKRPCLQSSCASQIRYCRRTLRFKLTMKIRLCYYCALYPFIQVFQGDPDLWKRQTLVRICEGPFIE